MSIPKPTTEERKLELAIRLVRECEEALDRKLSAGECGDLLCDNFDWLEGIAEAKALVAKIPEKI